MDFTYNAYKNLIERLRDNKYKNKLNYKKFGFKTNYQHSISKIIQITKGKIQAKNGVLKNKNNCLNWEVKV